VQTARPDVFGFFIHGAGQPRDFGERVVGEAEPQPLGAEQGDVLLDQGVPGLPQDADEIVLPEGRELHPDGEASLELRDEVGRFGYVKSARGDEEDVIGPDHAVARADGRSLDEGEDVALHPLAADVGAVTRLPAGDLVDFIEEEDPVLLRPVERLPGDLLIVDQLLLLLLHDVFGRLLHGHAALSSLLFGQAREEVPHVELEFLQAGALEELEGDGADGVFAHLQFDDALFQFSRPQLTPQPFARLLQPGQVPAVAEGALLPRDALEGLEQEVEETFLGVLLRLPLDFVDLLPADHVHRDLHQVAHHRFHVAPDIPQFGEFGRLHLQEGGVGQPREAAGDLGLAHSGRSDHDDVLGHHLLGHLLVQLLPADPVAQGDGHRLLGRLLTDDIAVESAHYFPGRHFVQAAGRPLAARRPLLHGIPFPEYAR